VVALIFAIATWRGLAITVAICAAFSGVPPFFRCAVIPVAGKALCRPALQATVLGWSWIAPCCLRRMRHSMRQSQLRNCPAATRLVGFLAFVLTIDAPSFVVPAVAIVLIGGPRALSHDPPAKRECRYRGWP
jgi:hypothetical protein